MTGGAGNDVLTGAAGADRLTGAAGSDTFDFNSLSEMGVTSGTWDVVTDFTHGADKIDLSTLDANTGTAANDAFSGTLVSHFTAAGQLMYDGVHHILYGNTDGDTSAEFAIVLNGVTSLSGVDFVL